MDFVYIFIQKYKYFLTLCINLLLDIIRFFIYISYIYICNFHRHREINYEQTFIRGWLHSCVSSGNKHINAVWVPQQRIQGSTMNIKEIKSMFYQQLKQCLGVNQRQLEFNKLFNISNPPENKGATLKWIPSSTEVDRVKVESKSRVWSPLIFFYLSL